MSIKGMAKTQQDMGLSELLLYQTLIEEDVMELKNGSLLSGFWYTGPDLESATKEEIEALSAYVNRAFARLGKGWMIHFEMIRKPAEGYPEGFFTEPINMIIDLERFAQHQQEGRHFETKIALFFTYLPPIFEQSGGARNVMNFITGESEDKYKEVLEKNLKYFQDKIWEIENVLTASKQIRLSRMGISSETHGDVNVFYSDLLQALNYVINGHWQPVRLPLPAPTYLDTMLARDLLVGYPLVHDNKYLTAISIMGYPQGSYPGILHELALLPFELRWSNRFICMDYLDAKGKLDKLRRQWSQKIKSFVAQILNIQNAPMNLDAVNMVDDLEAASTSLDAGDISYGNHTSVILIRGNSAEELEEIAREVIKVCEFRGFMARIEKRNGMEAFLGSLPGNGYENVRRPLISSLNFSDIMESTTDWTGALYCPSGHFPPKSPALLQAASVGSTPFRLNLHDGDVGHTLILGPTGAGKSTLLSLLASQFERYEDARIFMFDKGYSIYPLVSACMNAAHYDIGSDAGMRFCPLAALDTPIDRMDAQEWLEAAVVLSQGIPPTPEQRDLIHQALVTLANTTNSSNERTMTHFLGTIQDNELRQILSYYAGDRPGGLLLDGESNDIQYRPFTVFELDSVFNMDKKLVMPILLFLFREIEKRLNMTIEGQKNPPSLIIIDEAWTALSHEMFQAKIREWLLVLRKKNCAVILATQNLTDIVNSPIRQTILDSCFTRILLPNPSAKNDDLKELYMGHLGLNKKQVDIIANAVMKRHYYYSAPNSRNNRLFDLGLAPVALSFVGATGKDDLKAVRKLQNEYGKLWVKHWLYQRNLSTWGDLWESKYLESQKRG
jgi:type IV secretion system protein VirB4